MQEMVYLLEPSLNGGHHSKLSGLDFPSLKESVNLKLTNFRATKSYSDKTCCNRKYHEQNLCSIKIIMEIIYKNNITAF